MLDRSWWLRTPTPEMWWAETNIRWTIEWDGFLTDRGIEIDPPHGGTYRGSTSEPPWYDVEWKRFWVYSLFFLGRDRQGGPGSIVGLHPTWSTMYQSRPRVEAGGTIRISTVEGGWFDVPSIEASMVLGQAGYLDGARAFSTTRTIRLASIVDRSEETAERVFAPELIAFPQGDVTLDGSHDLLISLSLTISFRVDGGASYGFNPLEGDTRFWLRIPQWNLVPVSEIFI